MKAIRALWRSLRSLEGNQRACLFTEPLWSVPYNLFLPFVSLYMSAVGLSDAQIGILASLYLASQFLWGLFSGAIVDKYGRRRTMLVFGLLAWTIPCALWATAQGFWQFAAATALNGMWRVTGNSFSCMIVEDGDTERLVHIFTILYIMGLLAGFLAPLAGLFIGRFSLAPTMRALYAIAMALMTAKFLLQFRMARESSVGLRRRAETRGCSLLSLTFGGWPAFVAALGRKRMLLCVVLAVLMTCFDTIQGSFWPLFVASEYGVSDSMLSVFPSVKAVVTLLVFLLIVPRVSLARVRRPLLAGIGAQGLGLAVLLALMPLHALWAVFFSAACQAFALAMLGPLFESLMATSIPGAERARINSMIYAAILLISTPAGWIAGRMAESSRVLPLAMNLCLIAAEVLVALGIVRVMQKKQVGGVA